MSTVTFSTDLGAPPDGTGEVVIPGPLFAVGSYPEKNFSLSEDEADAAIAAFSPVPMNSEHHDDATFHGAALSGAWGNIEKIWRNGSQIMADYKLPAWLAQVVRDKKIPLKTSAEWDRTSKRLVAAAWTLKPYLTGNELVAAFSGANDDNLFNDDMTVKVPHPDHSMITQAGWTRGADTGDNMFNKAARYTKGKHVAKYYPSHAEKAGPGEDDGKPWQYHHADQGIIHQHPHLPSLLDEHDPEGSAIANGMAKAKFSENMKTLPEEHAGLIKDGWKHHGWDESGVHHYSKFEPETGYHGLTYNQHGHGIGKAKGYEGPGKGQKWRYHGDYASVGGKPGANLLTISGNTAQEVISTAKAKSTAAFSASASPELRELAQLRTEKLRREAEDFAESMVRQEKAVPGERGPMIAMFMALQTDDREHGDAVVRFNEASQPTSRVVAFKALYEARPAHGLSAELLDPKTQPEEIKKILANFSTIVNPAKTEGMNGESAEITEARRQELLAATPLGRELLKKPGGELA